MTFDFLRNRDTLTIHKRVAVFSISVASIARIRDTCNRISTWQHAAPILSRQDSIFAVWYVTHANSIDVKAQTNFCIPKRSTYKQLQLTEYQIILTKIFLNFALKYPTSCSIFL